MTSISAVVVHFRGAAALDRCVETCLAAPALDEILLVDNEGVADRLRRRHPDRRVRVIAMGGNVGYGRAANAGLGAATGDAILVLNQDVVVPRDGPMELLGAGASSGAWVVGPRLVDATGTEAPPKERFPAPLEWPGRAAAGDGWREVPWVAGAVMLFMPGHTDLRFDPRIFMYGEDEELCWRVWRDGGRVVVADRVRVVHEGGTAASSVWGSRAVVRRAVINRARFVAWHAGWRAVPAYLAATARRRLTAGARR